ncbi:hypothetical protein D3C72_186040 [compost metagenome]
MVDKLPDNRKQLNASYRFSGANVDKASFEKRHIVNLLPGVNQTETLQKFFAASADHLFEPGQSKPLNGYIGRPVSYSEEDTNYYLEEDTKERSFYQLEPSMVSIDENGDNKALLFYEDLINNIRFQGGLVNNHHRLFSQDYFSWCPSIDLDKFLNFREYYWIPEGPTPVEIRGHAAKYVGDGSTRVFNLTPNYPAPVLAAQVSVTVDGIDVPFAFNAAAKQVTLTPPPAKDTIVKVFSAVSSTQEIKGKTTFAFENDVKLEANLRIVIKNDKEQSLIGRIYIVEGVGEEIVLIEDNTPDLGLKKDHIVIQRGASDGNPWSTGNRWFHKSLVLNFSKESLKNAQARRPIIEFVRNIQLFNYGSTKRKAVHLVSHSVNDFLGAINGQTSSTKRIDGVILNRQWIETNGTDDTIRVLVINDDDSRITNRVYRVSFNPTTSKMKATLVADGTDVSGAPYMGESVDVLFGTSLGGMNLHWNGELWQTAQRKLSANQFPLFYLYDANGVAFDDVGIYPNSNFAGCRLFGYREDSTLSSVSDKVLGLRLVYDAKGEIQFENYLATYTGSYRVGVDTFDLPEQRFYKIVRDSKQILTNDWYAVGQQSRQMVVDKFVAANGHRLFTASQEAVEPISENLKVKRNNVELKQGVDYIRRNNQVLLVDLNDGDKVDIATFNPANKPLTSTGQYEIPLNLEANPKWEQITYATRGDLFEQFIGVIRSQAGFEGLEYSSNNWKDIPKDLSKGSFIVSHTAPLLRTMLLNSNKDIDFVKAAAYAQDEYARFRGKFDQKIKEFMISNKLGNNATASDWVDLALEEIAKGFTHDFPFFYSKMAAKDGSTAPNFIPPTPSFLGVYPIQEPSIYVEPILGKKFIIGHDGSSFPFYDDMRDAVTLELETRIYYSAPDFVREHEEGYFDHKSMVSNKFYSAEYSSAEMDTILRPMFEKWSVNFGIDYRINDTYDANDPFTWNWRSCVDRDNQFLPGHWRGVYNFYYGTDRPHTHPWEMLGFEYMPAWWVARYGTAPYGSGNILMWRDIQAGKIAEGPKAGTYSRFAKPNLLNWLPVDDQGNLLNPLEAKITNTPPRSVKASEEWVWGDGAPAESAWKQSFWYPFALAQACYLMKPPRFVETTWDIERNLDIVVNQGFGFPYKDEYVHSELLFDGTIAYRHGTQQWVVDYLKSKNKNVTENLGALIRGLDVKLAYKVAGFTESNGLYVVSDNIDRLPPEDVSVELYKSPSIREEFLGGILIRKVANGWKIFGYDILDPVFKIIPSDVGGRAISVTAGSAQRVRIPNWKQSTYYPTNTTVRYLDKFYRAIKTHTSLRSFETQYWVEVARPAYADAAAVEYYRDAKNDQIVERIPYGSLIRTPQEMATFISGYERYLVSRGWLFDTVASDDAAINDWRLSLKDYLAWAQDADVKDGDMISLIPNSGEIHFNTEHGNVEPIEQIVNGVYSILDKLGNPIKAYNTNVVRDAGSVVIQTRSNQEMYACRLHVSEIEHVIVVNNTTIFGDIVYSPLFNIRQNRLRLQGFKTKFWQGRVEAPGFLVTGNKLTVNFEKAADDFRRLFDVESIENSNLKDRARANFGYQEKEYLSNLLMTPTNQFEFHQGVIQQKGTISAMRKLFRSKFVRHNDGLNVLEEWGFRIGEYGASEIRPSMDFLIKQGDFKNSPQMFQFNGSGQGGWDLRLAWDSDHWDYLKNTETVRATYNINGIKKVTMTNKGSGYMEAPLVNVVGDSSGASLRATLNWASSGIAEIKVVRGGTGFFEGDVLEIDGTGVGASAVVTGVDFSSSKVLSAYVIPQTGTTGAGAGYAVGQEIRFTGGNGNAKATITEVTETGAIVKLAVTSPGAGYEALESILFPNFNTSADGRIGIKVSGGRANVITVSSAGQGYDPSASVRFTGNGTGAIVQIKVTGGSISGVEVVNRGSGFETIPAIEFVGGNPTVPATAVATLQDAPQNGIIEIAKFKRIEGVILKSFTVKVLDEFNGVQPQLTIGDESDNARYVGALNLATRTSKTYTLDDGQQISNAALEVNAYITNAQESGNLEISFTFEYTPNYYTGLFVASGDDKATKIYDLFNNETGEFMHKDPRWVWRHSTQNPDWPLVDVKAKDKGNLPSAGYVHLDDVKWTSTSLASFNALYRRRQREEPSSAITNTVTIKYAESSTVTRRINIVPNLSQGMYRIKNFVVDIIEAFPLTTTNEEEVLISIGTIAEPEKFMEKTAVNTDKLQTYTHQVFEYLTSKLNDENALYVFVTQVTGLAIAPGEMTVTANLELIGDIVLPGDRAWTYNTGYGDWDVFRLGDTSANITITRPQSFSTQGTIVSTSTNMFDALGIDHNPQEPRPEIASLNPTFLQDIERAEARMERTILDGILPDNNTTEMLLNNYKAKFKNTVKIFIDAGSTLRNNGNSLVQIPIMDMWADSGIVINKITASVVRPFTYPAGNNPTITVGTLTDRDRFIGAVNSSTAFRNVKSAPGRPTFSYATPITVNVYDDAVVLNEDDTSATIRLVRNGNVFVTPSNITVTNPGWGYTSSSDPKITVLGPTGVKAKAKIVGTIIGYAVTNPGTGYTSAPTITVIGGGGTGAKGTAVLDGDKLDTVVIPGAGTGTSATANLNAGAVGGISDLQGGSGWEMLPIVTFEGGNPTSHAAVKVEMSNGVVNAVLIDYAGAGYASAPEVKFHAYTGDDYVTEPRVVVSGGGGTGATVEPIMLWTVRSIAITDWGKCSWVGGESSVTVEAPNGGAPAQAILVSTPETLEPTTLAQWRHRVIEPATAENLNEWVYETTPIEFPAPTGTNSPDFYTQAVQLPISSVDERTTYEIEFPEFVLDTATGEPTTTKNVTNGIIGTTTRSLVTVHNTVAGSRDIDLKVAGTRAPFYLNENISSDNKMVAFYNSDGVSDGLLTLVIDYHYTSGFELFDADDNPVRTSITGSGGDIFAWNSVRFDNNEGPEDPLLVPVDTWKIGDRILLDDGRSTEERAVDWQTDTNYEYHELVSRDGTVYRAIQTGSGLEASIAPQDNDIKSLDRPVITSRGSFYTHEPTVTITGDGQDAAAYVMLAPTSIYKIKVLNPEANTGYTGTEKLNIAPKNLAGKGAEARIGKVENGAITEVIVLDAGWGYDAAPIVTVVNDVSDTPVQFECVMKPARIKAIVMTHRGTGYTNATLSFTTHGVTTTSFVPAEWEVSSEAESGWRVLERVDSMDGHIWQEIRQETPKIDSSMIESAVIYDVNTSETLQMLQLYDPFKGFIPGSAKKEISYILEYDPAIYSNGPLAKSINSNERLWDSAKVGDIWWDISTTRYLDYEIGETEYKWKNWGKLAPGITIDIYEWTRSTVAPAFWAAEVEKKRNVAVESDEHKPTGTVKDINSTASWVERTEYNKALSRNETVYYFWVKNSATLPFREDRNLTATQIAAIIQDPTAADIPWFAIVDTNKVLVGGAKQYVNDYSTSLKLEWKKTKNDGLVHKQYKLLREGDERNNIDEALWVKMRDSLVGWDQNTQRKTFVATLTTELNSLSTSFTVDDATGFDPSGEIKIGDYWIQYEYLNENTFVGLTGVGTLRFGVGTKVYQTRTVESFRKVPDQWLNERERYGALSRPGQTWFKSDTDQYGFLIPGRDARKSFVDTMNEIFASEAFLDTRYEWREIFESEEPQPDSTSYAFEVVDEFERDQLALTGVVKPGQKVFMQGTPDTNGLWTLWIYLPTDARASETGYVMFKAQRYRLREGELWSAVDWYHPDWSINDFPVKRYATRQERDADKKLDTTLLRGTLVQIDSQGPTDPRWAWYVFKDGSWIQVAKEKATIRLNENFYAKNTMIYGFNDYKVASSKKRDGSWELQYLLTELRTKLLTSLERNKLFFSMVKTAVSQHNYTDWVFKTSFLYMAGYNEQLNQSPIVFKDQIDNILNYINDVKPYHVKVRDFVRRLSPPMELMNITITDFDKPLYYDETTQSWRKLNVNNAADELILRTDPKLRHWYENYQKTNYTLENWNEQWNPVRRPQVTMLFDRVSCNPIVGWSPPEVPWDGNEQRWVHGAYTKTFGELEALYRIPGQHYQQLVVDTTVLRDQLVRDSQNAVNSGQAALIFTGDVVNVKSGPEREPTSYMWSGTEFVEFYNVRWDMNVAGGLADRIERYYEPTATMKRKELNTLIRGCDFRGTVVDGADLDQGLWDMFAWDSQTGWANEYEYYVGRDLNINPNQSTWEDANSVEDIRLEGGELVQPWFEGGHPDELVRLRVRDPLVMTVYRQATAQGNMPSTQPTAFRFFKDSVGAWEGVYLEDDGLTLADPLNPADQTMRVNVPGLLPLHDPANPNLTELHAKIALSIGVDLSKPIKAGTVRKNGLFNSLGLEEALAGKANNDIVNDVLEARINDILSRYVDGVVWIGTERITYRGITDNGDGTFTLTGLGRGTGGTSRMVDAPINTKLFDGSVLHALLTFNTTNMRAQSTQDFQKNWKTWWSAANAVGTKPGPTPE